METGLCMLCHRDYFHKKRKRKKKPAVMKIAVMLAQGRGQTRYVQHAAQWRGLDTARSAYEEGPGSGFFLTEKNAHQQST